METQRLTARTKLWLGIVLTVVVGVIATIGALVAVSADSRRFLTLDVVVEGLRVPDAGLTEFVVDVEDATRRECPAAGCVEAVQGQGITLFRFTTATGARTFSKALGRAGSVSDRIVLRVDDPTLPQEEQGRLVDHLDGIWRSHGAG